MAETTWLRSLGWGILAAITWLRSLGWAISAETTWLGSLGRDHLADITGASLEALWEALLGSPGLPGGSGRLSGAPLAWEASWR